MLINDAARFGGVAVVGVDEHVWRPTRRGDKCVTVIIDLTPVRGKTGPARLLDMIEGRSKRVFADWLAQRTKDWRDRVEGVAMEGFSRVQERPPRNCRRRFQRRNPFHVVCLAGNAFDECGRRVQAATCGRRGRKTDPLYRARRTLHTGVDLLTDTQEARLTARFAVDTHDEVEATWQMYQRTVSAYREPDRRQGRTVMASLITTLSVVVPQNIDRSDCPRADPDHSCRRRAGLLHCLGTSSGPTEAIFCRLERLRGSALGFRNLTDYIARSLLEIGGFRPQLHRQ